LPKRGGGRILGEVRSANRGEVTAVGSQTSESPLVGREYELDVLRVALDEARRRRTQLVEIVGEAGLGKTRLVEELPRLAAGFFHHSVTCERYRSSEAYFPLRSLLRTVAGIPPTADAAEAGVLLRSRVESMTPDLLPVLRLLEAPFGADTGAQGDPGASDPSRRRNLMHGAIDTLLTATLGMPTLLVFEDTQWMDEASRALLDHLVHSAVSKPWLVCVTRRPEGEAIATQGGTTVIALSPLEPKAAASLARAAARSGLLPNELEQVVARSGGNPFFIRELVAHAPDRTLPESVHSILRDRLEALEPEDRVTLAYAAAIGRRFDLRLLRRVMELAGRAIDLDRRIGALSSFVVELEPDRFLFRHDLIQEAAYALLEGADRASVHGLIAAELEHEAGSAVEEIAAELARHFREADDWEQTWRYAVLAGRTAQARYAAVVAADLFESALEVSAFVAVATPTEVAEVHEALGDTYWLAGRYERADAEFQVAETLVRGSNVALARILRKRAECAEKLSLYRDALALLSRALELIPDPPSVHDEARERAEIELLRGGVALRQGRADVTLSCCDHAIEYLGRDAADLATLAHAYFLREMAQEYLPGPRTDEYRLRALAIYEELGDVTGWANVANSLGMYEYFAGRWEEALRLYRPASKNYRRIGDINNLAGTLNNEGEVLSDQGHLREAEALFVEARQFFDATQSKLGVAITTRNLGRLSTRIGRPVEAEQALRRALAELVDIGSEDVAAEAKAYLAEALVLDGRHREAYEIATGTLDALDDKRSPGLTALLERVAGYAALQNFEPDVAADHFRSSLASAEEDGAVYERALTLIATAELAERSGLEEPAILRAEAQLILDRLGVVALPSVPLPDTFFEPHEHRL
jgi:tetratricopeptide (TPR) repeat protein